MKIEDVYKANKLAEKISYVKSEIDKFLEFIQQGEFELIIKRNNGVSCTINDMDIKQVVFNKILEYLVNERNSLSKQLEEI